jgi:hypothetical protein
MNVNCHQRAKLLPKAMKKIEPPSSTGTDGDLK